MQRQIDDIVQASRVDMLSGRHTGSSNNTMLGGKVVGAMQCSDSIHSNRQPDKNIDRTSTKFIVLAAQLEDRALRFKNKQT